MKFYFLVFHTFKFYKLYNFLFLSNIYFHTGSSIKLSCVIEMIQIQLRVIISAR